MFEEDFSFIIEQRYPYPIAVSFRRLETDEYMEKGPKRLKGLLEVAERTIHFLSHVVLINLLESIQNNDEVKPPGNLVSDFERKFSALSFGNMLNNMREGLRFYDAKSDLLFIGEIYGYFFDTNGKISNAQESFNKLVEIRNKLAHPTHSYSTAELDNYCEDAEKAVTVILEQLSFITKYELLNVNQIEVIKRRNRSASFRHRFSKVIGVSENFRAKEDHYPRFMDSHAIVLKKKDSFEFINLSPLLIFSSEGEKQVPDIFLYLSKKGTGHIYSACHNGGNFDSRKTSIQQELHEDLAVIFNIFSGKES